MEMNTLSVISSGVDPRVSFTIFPSQWAMLNEGKLSLTPAGQGPGAPILSWGRAGFRREAGMGRGNSSRICHFWSLWAKYSARDYQN